MGERRGSMKRHGAYAGLGAVGLALIAGGAVRAADLYTYQSLITLDSPVEGGATISGDFEVGGVNASGVVAFVSEFGNGEGGLTVGPDGRVQVLSQPGADAPGGGVFANDVYSPLWINDAGNIAMGEDVDDGTGSAVEILYYDKAANKWTVVEKEHMAAPDGGTFTRATLDITGGFNMSPAIDNANNIAFGGNVTGSPAGPAGNGIFLWSPTTQKLTTIARPGTRVTRGVLSEADSVAISNSNGYITFEGDVGNSGNHGAYVAKDGVITELAAPHTVAPGGTDRFTRARFPHANSSGDVVMLGRVGTSQYAGLYLYTAKDKKLTAIVKPGDTLPGGGTLTTVERGYSAAFHISDDGSVVFGGQLDDGTGGVYVYKNGTITPVAKTGQNLAGVGLVDQLAGTGGLPPGGAAINSKGQIAFPAHTADGETHLVLATPAAAPAPTAGP
jgi:hypothetical protein